MPDHDQTQLVELLRPIVSAAVHEAMELTRPVPTCLTPEEQEWVRKAIEAESRKIRFRDAVIEKSLAGLVWAALLFLGAAVWSYVRTLLHGGQ